LFPTPHANELKGTGWKPILRVLSFAVNDLSGNDPNLRQVAALQITLRLLGSTVAYSGFSSSMRSKQSKATTGHRTPKFKFECNAQDQY
jgi:hypothetical protein